MTKILCDTCNAEIIIPKGYTEPFIQCPDCGALQKYVQKPVAGEPKFKILDEKGRERAANQVVGEEYHEEEEPPKVVTRVVPKIVKQASKPRIEHKITSKIIDQKKLLIDSMGEDGYNKALRLVAGYIYSSERARKNGRVKAIQQLMKDKYPLDLATRAVEYAEKSEETLDLVKSNKSKNLIGAIIIVVVIVIGLFIFLV